MPKWLVPAVSLVALLVAVLCIWAWAAPMQSFLDGGGWTFYPLGVGARGQGLGVNAWLLAVGWFAAFGVWAGVVFAHPASLSRWMVVALGTLVFVLGLWLGVMESFLPPAPMMPDRTFHLGLFPLALLLGGAISTVSAIGVRRLVQSSMRATP